MKRRVGPRQPRIAHIPKPPALALALIGSAASAWKEVPTTVTVLGRVRSVYIGLRTGCPEPFYARWVKCRVPGEKEPRDIAAERFMAPEPKLDLGPSSAHVDCDGMCCRPWTS